MESPETIVLIPNLNGLEHLEECLNSLMNQTYKKYKVVFIDNGSSDGSVNFVKKNFKEVEIFCLEKNYGFAQAINKGFIYSIAKFDPKYFALLNNDTLVENNWLENLVKAINSEGVLFAVASNMLFYDNPLLINSNGAKMDFWGNFCDIHFGIKISDITQYPNYILGASGGAMLMRTKFLRKIGLFDEDYFTYMEDVDLGLRANLYGYRIKFVRDAIVYHKFSSTSKNNLPLKYYFTRRNGLITILKNYEVFTILFLFPRLFYQFLSYPLWALFNEGGTFRERLLIGFVPFKALKWNLKHFRKIIIKRKIVQSKRRISDKELGVILSK